MVGGGLLLAFEGVDGCGKSTQWTRCLEWLSARPDMPAPLAAREPGGTPLGESVRELLLEGGSMGPLAETLLYMAARAELYEGVILPALAQGRTVVLDRSHYSTAAYQGGGLAVDGGTIDVLTRVVTGGRLPDRVVLLDLPSAEAAQRLEARLGEAPDRIESRDAAYFERVAAAYRDLARRDPERFVVVDACGTPDDVERRVQEALGDVV
ncbi:MAG: dTMP kinase [Planctomycetota bacterium]|jgi:dTMP kinase